MLDRVREPVQQVAVRPRLIPVLLLKHGVIVRSQLFKVHQVIGNPMSTVERLSQWNVDELVILDISRGEGGHDLRRDDLHQQYVGDSAIDVLREIAKVLLHAADLRRAHPHARRHRGAACRRRRQGRDQHRGIRRSGLDRGGGAAVRRAVHRRLDRCAAPRRRPLRGVRRRRTARRPASIRPRGRGSSRARGAGEIFLNSIDRDGSGAGYDIELIARVADAVDDSGRRLRRRRPLRALSRRHIEGGAAAAAAANIFHFFELSYSHAKQRLPRGRHPDAAGRAGLALPAARARLRPGRRGRADRPAPGRRGAGRLSGRPRRRRAPSGGRSAGARRASIRRSQRGADGVRRRRRVHRLPDGGGEGRDRAGRVDAPPRAAARHDRALPLPRRQPARRGDRGLRRQGLLFPDPRAQARVRAQPAARHLRRQQLDRRRLAQHGAHARGLRRRPRRRAPLGRHAQEAQSPRLHRHGRHELARATSAS